MVKSSTTTTNPFSGHSDESSASSSIYGQMNFPYVVKSSNPFFTHSSCSPSVSGSSSVHGRMNCPSTLGSSFIYGQINNSSATSSLNSSGGTKNPFASSTGEATSSASPKGPSGKSSAKTSSSSTIGCFDSNQNPQEAGGQPTQVAPHLFTFGSSGQSAPGFLFGTKSCSGVQKPLFSKSTSSSGTNDSRVAIQTGGLFMNGQQTASMVSRVAQPTGSYSFRSQVVPGSNSFRAQHELLVDDPGSAVSVRLGNPGIPINVFYNDKKVATFKVDDTLPSKEIPEPQVLNSSKDSPGNDKAKERSGQQGTSNNEKETRSNLSTDGVKNNDNHISERCFHVVVKEEDEGVIDNEEGEVTEEVGDDPDIAAIMPKIHSIDCYTEPPIKELAARERVEPGCCARVNDFVFGRRAYGSIKVLGETDVRKLDLESLIQFNHREVIVYMDESKKPPIGQGLNKPAEITVLNIECIDKKSKRAYTDGPKVEKYREILRQKAAELGAEMVAYDPQQGEWKLKFQHF